MARPLKNYCDYFPHDRDMRNHRKVKAIRTKFGITGYALWSMLLEYLTGIDGNEFEFSDTEMELMAGDFGVSVTEISDLLNYCIKLELLFLNDGFISSESLDERLSFVYDKRKHAKSKSKKQLRINGKYATINADTSGISVTETPQSKVNKSKVNKSKEDIAVSKNGLPHPESIPENIVSDLYPVKQTIKKVKQNLPIGLTTFAESEWADEEKFLAACPSDWPPAKKKHYFLAAQSWSEDKPKERKVNWIKAVIRWDGNHPWRGDQVPVKNGYARPMTQSQKIDQAVNHGIHLEIPPERYVQISTPNEFWSGSLKLDDNGMLVFWKAGRTRLTIDPNNNFHPSAIYELKPGQTIQKIYEFLKAEKEQEKLLNQKTA